MALRNIVKTFLSKDPVAAVDYATFGMRSVSEDDLLEEMIWNSSDGT